MTAAAAYLQERGGRKGVMATAEQEAGEAWVESKRRQVLCVRACWPWKLVERKGDAKEEEEERNVHCSTVYRVYTSVYPLSG